MNWTGALFGVGLALALFGGLGAAIMARTTNAAVFLAMTMAGIAAVVWSLGHGFVAALVLLLLAGAVPLTLYIAATVAPVGSPDRRYDRSRRGPILVVAGALLAALVMARASWPSAGGTRQHAIEWIGSRLMTDHLLLLLLAVVFLSATALGVVVLLRARTSR